MKEILERRSVRKYQDKDVSNNLIESIIDVARYAPSGKNTQPWHYLIIKDEKTREKIMKANNNQQWMMEAPVFIVCLGDAYSRFSNAEDYDFTDFSDEYEHKQVIRDTAIGISYLLLEAQRQGLATCWTAWFMQEDIKPVLNIPKYMYVVGVVTLGYGAENPVARPRKELSEIISYEKLNVK